MTKRAKLQAAAMIPFAVLLTACGQDRPVLILPAADLAECAMEPPAPELPPVDWSSVATARPIQLQRDLATLSYILSLRSAWGDCRAKVGGLASWRAEAGE